MYYGLYYKRSWKFLFEILLKIFYCQQISILYTYGNEWQHSTSLETAQSEWY